MAAKRSFMTIEEGDAIAASLQTVIVNYPSASAEHDALSDGDA